MIDVIRKQLEFCHLIGDDLYMKELVDRILFDYDKYKEEYFSPPLLEQIYLYFPYHLIPENYINKHFIQQWTANNYQRIILVNEDGIRRAYKYLIRVCDNEHDRDNSFIIGVDNSSNSNSNEHRQKYNGEHVIEIVDPDSYHHLYTN